MDHLRQILNQVLKSTPNYEENKFKVQLFEAWPQIVGARAARHCWPVKFCEDSTLLVGAESSVWLHSLRYLEAQILDKIEKEIGSRKVIRLRFMLATPSST